MSPSGNSAPSGGAPRVQQVSMPRGGGAVRGMGESYQANQFSGVGQLSIPFDVTPCRDFEPQVSLEYSSVTGNSPFGLGFEGPGGAITLRTSTGVPRYDATDGYLLDGNALVPVPGADETVTAAGVAYRVARYRSRHEAGFERVERWEAQDGSGTVFWRVLDGDDVIRVFGRSAEARIADPDNPPRVFRWLVEQEYDPRGNVRLYQYKQENTDNVPDVIYEHNRAQTAVRYLERIRYGNFDPIYADGPWLAGLPADDWHFEVVFDYGEYDPSAGNDDPYLPVRPWTARNDPYSTYNAGFERRTHRLCRGILLFHRFPAELAPQPVLTRVLELQYDPDPTVARLVSTRTVGYRYLPHAPAGQRYQLQALPPLTLEYVPFAPAEGEWARLHASGGGRLPPLLEGADYTLADLYGEGLPGILYADGETVLYYRPAAAAAGGAPVEYLPPTAPAQFPAPRQVTGGDQLLMDLDGDGRLELVEASPVGAGYYPGGMDGAWGPFRPFESFPPGFADPANELADLTGDGRTDLVLFTAGGVRWYPSLGTRGFGEARMVATPPGLPASAAPSERAWVGFADPFGTGTQHRVRITAGRMQVWPSLGWGRFGPVVELADVPQFGGALDASRLMLVDLDGTGAADLVYRWNDRLEAWLNQGGNRYAAEPVVIPLPGALEDPAQLVVDDVYGNGNACIVFAALGPQPAYWCYDPCAGRKPYLLAAADDHVGSRTVTTYASSVRYYLRDRQQGLRWVTSLPFPVQVVEQVETDDRVSLTRLVASYAYHHGYYDAEDREFRGFGYVERRETPSEDSTAAGMRLAAVQDGEPARFAPPQLMRTWFETGAWELAGAVQASYQAEFWRGDPDECPIPGPVFQGLGEVPDPRTLRQAYAALAGRVIRTELYGLDGSAAEAVPYQVSQQNWLVRLDQPAGPAGRHAVFYVHERETVDYDYERVPHDPAVDHTFTLLVDAEGNVERSCKVVYARRAAVPGSVPEQMARHVLCDTSEYVPRLDEPNALLFGLPAVQRGYEILDTAPPTVDGLYYTWEDIAAQVQAALGGGAGAGAPRAHPLTWVRTFYAGADGAEAPPAAILPQALFVRSDHAAFAGAYVAEVFDGVPVPLSLDGFLADEGGFAWEAANGFWWNPGGVEQYHGAADFYVAAASLDPFAARSDGAEGTTWTYGYDASRLVLTTVTTAAPGVADGVTRAERVDYRTLNVERMRDENGVVWEALADPLGKVVATSHYGTENHGGAPVATGFTPLPLETTETWPVPPDVDTVLADPAAWLRGAATAFYYDSAAWDAAGVPVHAIQLQAQDYPDPAAPDVPVGAVQVSLTFFDGLGRPVGQAARVEPGDAILVGAGGMALRAGDGTPVRGVAEERWVISGETRYNNKGMPFREYRPYYADTPFLDPHQFRDLPLQRTLAYDPLDRPVRMSVPRGTFPEAFFSETSYTAWDEMYGDPDDTILRSPYYQHYVVDGNPLPAQEREALVKAAAFADTPSSRVLDGRGRAVRTIERLAPVGGDLVSHFAFDALGYEVGAADPRLAPLGVWNLRTAYSMDGQVLRTESVDAGVRWTLFDVTNESRFGYDSRGTTVLTEVDALGRTSLRRVAADGAPAAEAVVVERLIYGDSLDADGETPYPAADGRNLYGRVAVQYDEAGRVDVPAATLQGQPLASTARLRRAYAGEPDWAAAPGLGWAALYAALAPQLEDEAFRTATAYDGLGRAVQVRDPAGNVRRTRFYVSGRVEEISLVSAEGAEERYLYGVEYNASNQRVRASVGEHEGAPVVQLETEWDPDTQLPRRMAATRAPEPRAVQDQRYWFDPAGNVTRVEDSARADGAGGMNGAGGTGVAGGVDGGDPLALDFTYDATYALERATGVAQQGLTPEAERAGGFEPFFPADGPPPLEPYEASFTYDDAGNLYRLDYASDSAVWTRELEVFPHSNRAVELPAEPCGDGAGGEEDEDDEDGLACYFDANGNQVRMSGMDPLAWDFRNLLASASVQSDVATDAEEFYAYDGAATRVRRVLRTQADGAVREAETLTLGSLRIDRVRVDGVVVEERQTVRVGTGAQALGERLRWVQGAPPPGVADPEHRFQVLDLLNSSRVEVGQAGEVLSVEGYAPFGATVFARGPSLDEVSLKAFRYTGTERDKATGLYHNGMRYYAPWMGRWASPDPAGIVDGLNLYAYVGGRVPGFSDPGGLAKTPTPKQQFQFHERVAEFNEHLEFPNPKHASLTNAYWDPQVNSSTPSNSTDLGLNAASGYKSVFKQDLNPSGMNYGVFYENQHVIPQEVANSHPTLKAVGFSTDNFLNSMLAPTPNFIQGNVPGTTSSVTATKTIKKRKIGTYRRNTLTGAAKKKGGHRLLTGVSAHRGYHKHYNVLVRDLVDQLSAKYTTKPLQRLATARFVTMLRTVHVWGLPIYPKHSKGTITLVGEDITNLNAVASSASTGKQPEFHSMWVSNLNEAAGMLEKMDPYKGKYPRFK